MIKFSEVIYINVITKGNIYLKLIGLQLDESDVNRSFLERLRHRRLCIITFILIILNFIGQLGCLVDDIINNKGTLIDITYLLSCAIICWLGFLKSYYFLRHSELTYGIIDTLIILYNNNTKIKAKNKDFETKSLRFLDIGTKVVIWASILSVTAFGVGPLVIMARAYYKTGELKINFPFPYLYPFDVSDLKTFSIIYVHQIWSALVAVLTFFGPDYICYALITLVTIQFFKLKEDIRSLIAKPKCAFINSKDFRIHFVQIITCHRDLIRCAEIIEALYSKTILLNVILSSIVISMSGFNIMAFGGTLLMPSFVAFLLMVLGQIFLLCYYGDILMRSSMEVHNAVYDCLWYLVDTRTVKDLLFILMRANKPCKLTAYGFSDVNLNMFTNILGTSWSYFALLQTIYMHNIKQNT